ncbi:FAD-linked oxidoreductase azaL [Apiospora phragmitis]|uniref:FAD-linked oxidoreductase azaL n=1 Tax=Apiospora phragmitis TaxID=2905665 RepID=A0ABR1WU47_9PEZI
MKAGKVTGICECVGVSAPILGGGHGWLQGQYGLAADQIISARLALPNGDVVAVSKDSNSDLFWAIRGAGHNFGLVVEWEYRIYDVKNPKWSYEIFIFSGDKLEALYELTNEMMKGQPPEPIIWYAIIYDGSIDTAREYAKPIHDIEPLMVNAGTGTVPEIAELTYQSEDSAGCVYGLMSLRDPIGLKTYNTAALRKVYDDIDETFRQVPELAGSFFLLEGYSTQGVQAVDEASTAFPHRCDETPVTSYVMYKPKPAIDQVAQAYGSRLRGYLLEGSEDPQHLRAYVNYAHGTESLQEMYGWEEWRLEKLKSLKGQWDPDNRRRYYAPIA